ncbi:RSVR protein, partial [Probosciger aterrimus]|nr:RSVR protein [Probosciger aterrimus]
PGRFRCAPNAPCVTREWLCDGHPDCDDGEDELGCGTVTPAEPSPDGAAEPRTDVQTRHSEWFSACALSSLALLSILVAVGSVAVWGISKAKSRSDIFSPEKASREQLMPDKSQ